MWWKESFTELCDLSIYFVRCHLQVGIQEQLLWWKENLEESHESYEKFLSCHCRLMWIQLIVTRRKLMTHSWVYMKIFWPTTADLISVMKENGWCCKQKTWGCNWRLICKTVDCDEKKARASYEFTLEKSFGLPLQIGMMKEISWLWWKESSSKVWVYINKSSGQPVQIGMMKGTSWCDIKKDSQRSVIFHTFCQLPLQIWYDEGNQLMW